MQCADANWRRAGSASSRTATCIDVGTRTAAGEPPPPRPPITTDNKTTANPIQNSHPRKHQPTNNINTPKETHRYKQIPSTHRACNQATPNKQTHKHTPKSTPTKPQTNKQSNTPEDIGQPIIAHVHVNCVALTNMSNSTLISDSLAVKFYVCLSHIIHRRLQKLLPLSIWHCHSETPCPNAHGLIAAKLRRQPHTLEVAFWTSYFRLPTSCQQLLHFLTRGQRRRTTGRGVTLSPPFLSPPRPRWPFYCSVSWRGHCWAPSAEHGCGPPRQRRKLLNAGFRMETGPGTGIIKSIRNRQKWDILAQVPKQHAGFAPSACCRFSAEVNGAAFFSVWAVDPGGPVGRMLAACSLGRTLRRFARRPGLTTMGQAAPHCPAAPQPLPGQATRRPLPLRPPPGHAALRPPPGSGCAAATAGLS